MGGGYDIPAKQPESERFLETSSLLASTPTHKDAGMDELRSMVESNKAAASSGAKQVPSIPLPPAMEPSRQNVNYGASPPSWLGVAPFEQAAKSATNPTTGAEMFRFRDSQNSQMGLQSAASSAAISASQSILSQYAQPAVADVGQPMMRTRQIIILQQPSATTPISAMPVSATPGIARIVQVAPTSVAALQTKAAVVPTTATVLGTAKQPQFRSIQAAIRSVVPQTLASTNPLQPASISAPVVQTRLPITSGSAQAFQGASAPAPLQTMLPELGAQPVNNAKQQPPAARFGQAMHPRFRTPFALPSGPAPPLPNFQTFSNVRFKELKARQATDSAAATSLAVASSGLRAIGLHPPKGALAIHQTPMGPRVGFGSLTSPVSQPRFRQQQTSMRTATHKPLSPSLGNMDPPAQVRGNIANGAAPPPQAVYPPTSPPPPALIDQPPLPGQAGSMAPPVSAASSPF